MPEEQGLSINKIQISKEQNLVEALYDFKQKFSNRRGVFNGQSVNIDMEEALKLSLPEDNMVKYSLIIENLNEELYSFSNLVIKESANNAQEFLVINYLPEKDWVEGFESEIDWSSFTGVITEYNLDGEKLKSAVLQEGVVVSDANSSGRIQDMYECEGDVACYWNSTLGHYFCTYELYCYPKGGTGNDGSNNGDDTGSGDTSGSDSDDDYVGGGGDSPADSDSDDDPGSDSDSDDSPDPIGIFPDPRAMIPKQLKMELAVNPFALLEVDCEELGEKWNNLAEHTATSEVITRVNQLNQEGYDIEMQYLDDAFGAVVNMDYFPVEISQLPENPATGETFTGAEFFNHIRENFSDICFSDNSSFGPYNVTEANRWNSMDFLGTVMRFDISVDFFGINGSQDGSVLCTDQQSQSWIFSTIYTSQDYNHPVSGNREFGLLSNPDGTYTFYTSGVDRIAERTDVTMGEFMGYGAFDGGEELWSNLQNNLKVYVSEELNGGVATVGDSTVSRIDIEKLESVLDGTKPVSELGCN